MPPADRSDAATGKRAGWRPTHAYLRASLLAVGLLVAALLAREPGLVVVATPFLVLTAWSLHARPGSAPAVRHPRSALTIREGDVLSWPVSVDAVPHLELTSLVFERGHHRELRPEGGTCVGWPADGETQVTMEVLVRATRWGHQPVGRALVSATSPWAAFRWGPLELPSVDQVTLPLPPMFAAAAPSPHPVGLVGLNRSARRGEGAEFATIRQFQAGDRLRRIHWPVSLRTGTLHVTATWADQDAQIMLMVDASADLGTSEGIDGFASSLDVTVRAAGSIAEHFLRHGDRVGLCVFGPDVTLMNPTAGTAHLRRVLRRLADTTAGNRNGTAEALQALRLGGNTTVVMLSACVSQLALHQAATLTAQGVSVIVVDTLPEQIGGLDEPALQAVWRVRRLERRTELRMLARRGVPVVAWRGPGSLDPVLRDLARRRSAPRLVPR